MNIVILLQNFSVGGIQRLIVDEANELFRRGYEVRIVYFEAVTGETLVADLRVPKERIVRIEYPRMRDLSGFRTLTRFLRETKPDIVFTHHWFANTVGRLAGWIARARVIPFEHSDYSSHYSCKQQLFDRMLQAFSRRIVAVSDAVRSSLIRRGICADKVVVIPNGIDLTRFSSINKKNHKGFAVLFAGRLVADKCVSDIVRAIARVRGTHLFIAGSGPEEQALRALADELDVTDRVSFLGMRSITDVLACVDCLVLPSRREGFGLTAIEALATGVPAIVSTTANAAGAVNDGVNGYVVPVGDVGALSAAINRMASNPAEHARLATSARHCLERFSIQRHVDRLLEIVHVDSASAACKKA